MAAVAGRTARLGGAASAHETLERVVIVMCHGARLPANAMPLHGFDDIFDECAKLNWRHGRRVSAGRDLRKAQEGVEYSNDRATLALGFFEQPATLEFRLPIAHLPVA